MDAAVELSRLEAAYDAADAQLSAAIELFSKLRDAPRSVLGEQGAVRWMRAAYS